MTIHHDSRSAILGRAAAAGSVTALVTFVASWASVLFSWADEWKYVLWLPTFGCLLGLGLAASRSRRELGVGVIIGAVVGYGFALATALAVVVFVIGDV